MPTYEQLYNLDLGKLKTATEGDLRNSAADAAGTGHTVGATWESSRHG